MGPISSRGSSGPQTRIALHRINIAEASAGEVWFILTLIPDLAFPEAEESASLAREFEEIEKILASLRRRFEDDGSV